MLGAEDTTFNVEGLLRGSFYYRRLTQNSRGLVPLLQVNAKPSHLMAIWKTTPRCRVSSFCLELSQLGDYVCSKITEIFKFSYHFLCPRIKVFWKSVNRAKMEGSEFLIKNLSDLFFADASMLALEVGNSNQGEQRRKES